VHVRRVQERAVEGIGEVHAALQRPIKPQVPGDPVFGDDDVMINAIRFKDDPIL